MVLINIWARFESLEAIFMAKSLFWSSDEAWKALSPHLSRGRSGKPRVGDRTVISGILHVWKMAVDGATFRFGPPTTFYNRPLRPSSIRPPRANGLALVAIMIA